MAAVVLWNIKTIDTDVRKKEMKITEMDVREEIVVVASSEDVRSVCKMLVALSS